MEPIVFKTKNENCYLYSPAEKSLILIPSYVYDEISINGSSDHPIWLTLVQAGYLKSFVDPFNGCITKETIINAVDNLSQIVFETTTMCNLRCEYCCYGDGYITFDARKKQSGHLKFETAKSIIDYISDIFKKQEISSSPSEPFAISFYGGEPLMNFSVVKQIVEYAENIEFRNKILSFTMTSNATMLAKYADFLQAHKFKMLISLDGDKTHHAYRKTKCGENSFDTVISNLREVALKYPAWFNTFRYNAVYTNISNIKEIVSWFTKEFNKIPTFSPLHTPTKGAKEYSKIKSMIANFEIPDELNLKEELLIQNPINKRIIEFCNHLFYNTINKESDITEPEQYNLPTGTCIPFSKRMFVSFDGKLHPCEKVNRDLPLGGITEKGTIEIDFKHISNEVMSRLTNMKSICQKCYLQLCCTKCMLCFDEGKCNDFVTKEKFSSILSQTVSYIEEHPNIINILEDSIIIK